jgi:Tannase and feruloyl esterase
MKSKFVLILGTVLCTAAGVQVRAEQTLDDEAARIQCAALASEDLSTIADAPTQIISAKLAASDAAKRCDVRGYVTPSVGFVMALPSRWNGKILQLGCGGHCGVVGESPPPGCEDALRHGYACIASDAGHAGTGADGLWAHDNLQAKIDWGYRAPHVTALAGKAVTARFYRQPARRSYFLGCSTGGRQGLQEAQRFPWDFDGIVAGSAPIDLATLYMTYVWGYRASHHADGTPLLGERELNLVTEAALAKCDADDGVKDGVISDPMHCGFRPADVACSPSRTNECLTSEQIDAVNEIYQGPATSTGLKLSLGGPMPGSERETWNSTFLSDGLVTLLITNGFRYFFFSPEAGAGWQYKDFDFDRDYKRFGSMEALVDASNPDLRSFKAAGGKLLMFAPTNDFSLLLRSAIDYYENVERTMGGRAATSEFARLFVLPGVDHCQGGPGADLVDYLSYLDTWVEQGHAPDRLLASHLQDADRGPGSGVFPLDPRSIAFTRPLFPYPLRARYSGKGDPNDAANFVAVGPRR